MITAFTKELIELLALRHMKGQIWIRNPQLVELGGVEGIRIKPSDGAQIQITAIRGTFDMGK